MRISDWSSDVCASDLAAHALISAECGQFIPRHCAGTKVTVQIERQRCFRIGPEVAAEACGQDIERIVTAEGGAVGRVVDTEHMSARRVRREVEIGRASRGERVGQYV